MSAGTEFNAFELLAKLRGGQPLPESSVGGAVPTNPHAKHAQQTSVQVRYHYFSCSFPLVDEAIL
jgi:hypothetical protein